MDSNIWDGLLGFTWRYAVHVVDVDHQQINGQIPESRCDQSKYLVPHDGHAMWWCEGELAGWLAGRGRKGGEAYARQKTARMKLPLDIAVMDCGICAFVR